MGQSSLAVRSNTEPPATLEEVEVRQIGRHLPLFAAGWLVTTLAWGLTLVLQSRLAFFPATVLFVFQLGVLIAAIAICHSAASRSRAPLAVLAACVLLGLSSTGLFAAIGGYGEMLAFILLTLFLASSPLFAWNGRAALVLALGTLVPWVVAIPFLTFFLRPAELALAISTGAMVCLVTLIAAQRNARVTQRAVASSNAYRELADAAPDMLFTIDLNGRFTYVNDALARFLGESPAALLGGLRSNFLTQNPGNPDLQELIKRVTEHKDLPAQTYAVTVGNLTRMLETKFSPIRSLDGRLVRLHGSARDITTRLAAEERLRTSLEELRRSEQELRQLLAQQPTPSPATASLDILGFDPHGEGSEERASVALLRKPLSALRGEELHRLKEEVDLLREEVKQQQKEIEQRVASVVENDEPAQRRRRSAMVPVHASAGISSGGPAPFHFPERYRRRRKRAPEDES